MDILNEIKSIQKRFLWMDSKVIRSHMDNMLSDFHWLKDQTLRHGSPWGKSICKACNFNNFQQFFEVSKIHSILGGSLARTLASLPLVSQAVPDCLQHRNNNSSVCHLKWLFLVLVLQLPIWSICLGRRIVISTIGTITTDGFV